MNTFLAIIGIVLFAVAVYYLREFVKSTLSYRDARSHEIKRRLQVEHKNEETLKHALANELDDNAKLKLEIRAAHERHQRAIHYVIQDMFERWQ